MGCVSLTQQVPSAEGQGGQCHLAVLTLDLDHVSQLVRPSQTCPPGLPELSPEWHLDQQRGMCALQETLSDPQEMIMIYSFFLRAVLIECPTTQGSYVIAFVC